MNKDAIYGEVIEQILAVIDGEPSATARYSSAACLLSQAFEHYFWTGFYVVDPQKTNELVVGAYQGTLGCLRIPFGKGVCGTAAATRKTQIVEDVHKFPGHIACDSRSNSEIVVPIYTERGELASVLDVDSTQIGSFDETDARWLEVLGTKLLIGATQH